MKFDKSFWESKWISHQTGWDVGYVSPPISHYIDKLENKDLKILIPGAGNSYEGEYLWKNGFKKVYLLDHSDYPFKSLLERCPDFPEDQLIVGDFFEHHSQYDLILEQTFFCALDPQLRSDYVAKMNQLLSENGKLAGLLFQVDFGNDHPPFGGNKDEYLKLFQVHFKILNMETALNSIPQRSGNELFIEMQKHP